MPYHADLRCSYARAELNICWFAEALDEMDFEYENICPRNTEMGKKEYELQDKMFDRYMDEQFNIYMIYKVFNHAPTEKHERELKSYEDVWQYLLDKAIEYSDKSEYIWVHSKVPEDEDEDEDC